MTANEAGLSGLQLHFDAATGQLLASVVADHDAAPLDEPGLRERIAAAGWGALRYLPNMALGLLANHNAGIACTLPIAEAVDAVLRIDLSPDSVEAWLDIVAAEGGQPASVEAVLALLADNGIGEGIDHAAIAAAVAAGSASHVVVARGVPPVDGCDGRLESLIPEVRDRRPQVDASGYIDYRELGDIFVVHAGDWLMLRHPPTDGTPGRTLLGETIPATPGKAAMFAASLPGTAFDPGNPDLLVAAITGQPVVVAGGMLVEPVFRVDQVSTVTGNVSFDGSVVVKGDVGSGMTVRASGDIEVGGVVDMGTLEAGGSIVVKGGAMGSLGRKTSEECHIRCEGSFHAAYAQQAKIEAGDSIFIDDSALQCELTAINHIRIGGKRRGHIVGGHLQATLSITGKVVGSSNRIATYCAIGVNPLLHKQLLQMCKLRDERETQLLEVAKLLDFAHKNPGRLRPEMIAKARATAAQLSAQIAEMREEQEQLTRKIELSRQSRLVARELLCEGVEVHLGNHRYKVVGEHGACAVGVGADGLELMALDEREA
ncbi:DUF342 domain-containing protein [Azonexus fungiphilus]|uniref:DUF342 domain-containing protein n=1 Tax=Azonexus fungiphilus TaxID=146940 RepID=UPI00156B7B70|nr:DUF342 domain-containing protein [Azonexus fungiphilus]